MLRNIVIFSLFSLPACGLILDLPDVPTDLHVDSQSALGGRLSSIPTEKEASDAGGADSLGGTRSVDDRAGGGLASVSVVQTASGAGGISEIENLGTGGDGEYPDGSEVEIPPGSGGTVGTCNGCECADSCDCDEDDHQSRDCGGDDCDDRDARVHPGQTDFFSKRSDNDDVGYDYDCSGELESPPTYHVLECGALLSVCEKGQGFIKSMPTCGKVGEWGSCASTLLGCETKTIDDGRVTLCH